jgi:arylsulfatase A-like enzyme
MKRLLKQTLTATAAVLTLARPGFAADASQPNVLFIAVDDLKPNIGAFGDELARTPHLDRLADRGTAFVNAHCQQAVCAPSRVSLLLGLRPDTTRIWDLKTHFRPILPDVVTLPERFKQAGYASVGMGKIYDPRSAGGRISMDRESWSEDFIRVGSPADETFSYLDPEVVQHITDLRAAGELRGGYHQQLKTAFPEGRPATERADVADEAYHDGAMTEVAKQRLGGFARSGEPFFLAVGYKKPHLPFNAPAKYWDLYDPHHFQLAAFTQAPQGAPQWATQPGWELRNHYEAPKEGPISEAMQRDLIHGYYACTSYIDAQVGELLAKLDETGLAENTLVVLWGDHGFHLGDHDMWCKHSNFEQATRSPLIIFDPRIEHATNRNASPVEFVDIYPTLLDLAGLEPAPGSELHGTSLKPILTGAADRVKDVAVSQYPRGVGDNAKMGYAFRCDRYRLVRWRDQDTRGAGELTGPVVALELYDYQQDPLETRNLADDPGYADVLADLQAKADAFRERQNYGDRP